MLPFILLVTLGSGYGGTLADKIGPRLPMILGPAIVGLSFTLLALPGVGANYFTSFFPALVLFGAGMALVIASLTKSALSVPEEYSGSASGVNNAVSRVAALLAVAILGAVALTIFRADLPKKVAASNIASVERQNILSQVDKLGGIKTENPEGREIVALSFVYSFRWLMGICASLALLSALISFLTIKNPNKK